MSIDQIVLAEIDSAIPYLRPMMNEYALHPCHGNAKLVESYLNILQKRTSKRHYEAMMHTYNGIQASNMNYGDK